VSVPVGAPALGERDALVSAEDEARVADAALHAGLVAGAAGDRRVLAAGLGAGGATRVVLAAGWALQSWRGGGGDDNGCLKEVLVKYLCVFFSSFLQM